LRDRGEAEPPNVDQEANTGEARDEDESSDTSETSSDVESSDDEATLSEPSDGEQEADEDVVVGRGEASDDGAWLSDDDVPAEPGFTLRYAGMVRVRREEAAAVGLPCRLGLYVIADVDADQNPCVVCETDVGADGDNSFPVEVPVLVAAREPCKIAIGKIVRGLQVGGVTLIPAGVAFACSHDQPPAVFVPLETVMTLRYGVIADREAETMRPRDEIAIRRAAAEAGRGRQGRRWTNDEVQILRKMVRTSADWNSIAFALHRSPCAVHARADLFASAPRRAANSPSSSADEGEDECVRTVASSGAAASRAGPLG
jgi:hypothetical protein